ncbi:MAG: putative Ig domain-containing protein [Gemmataceae bacterium]
MRYAILGMCFALSSLAFAQQEISNPLPPGSTLTVTAKAGQRFAFDLAMGRRGTFTMVKAPTGMTISREGQLQWTPNAEQVGTHEFQVKLAFDKDATELHRYRIAVEKSPEKSVALPKRGATTCGQNYGGALPKDLDKLPILRQFLPQKKTPMPQRQPMP